MRIKAGLVALVIGLTLAPLPRATATTTQIVLDGVTVDLPAQTEQVITARHTSGTYARVTFWQLLGGTWTQVAHTTVGRTGYGGLVDGTLRHQGSGTTPLGTYDLRYTFGSQARHLAWSMPYRKFDGNDYWVEDNASAYYNRYRSRDQGGARWDLVSKVNGSERLADYPTQYRMSVVVAYNYYTRVPYRGAGIFLHVNGPGATSGCVSAPSWFMRVVMDQLDPARKPVIAIGR
jgi:L,D-peptidoglycan transpeptidase YkuD (ErfK/YbiS/YcfS/YnhG family)